MNPTEAYKILVRNTKSLNFMEDALPCEILISGDSAFPVIVSSTGQVLVAASQYGKGRLVVMAHENYMVNPSFTQFIQNAIEWLKPTPDSLVGVDKKYGRLVQMLSGNGHKVEPTSNFHDDFGVYCSRPYNATQADQLIGALKGGAGLLLAGQAWYWVTRNKHEDVALDFPGNKVTSVAGINFLSDYGKKGLYFVTSQMPISSLITAHKLNISRDLKQILNGVTELRLPESGTPSHLVVHGERAFPLVLDSSHRTYLAAAYYGKGRVVVVTHEDHIGQPYEKKLVNNLVSWLDNGRDGIIGIQRDWKRMQDVLESSFESQLSGLSKSFSVYCCKSYANTDPQNMLEYVAEGGGLLIAGQAWHWAEQNAFKDAIIDYPGNQLINQFGITILGKGSSPADPHFIDIEDPSNSYQFRRALHQLKTTMDAGQEVQEPLASWRRKLSEDCAKLLAVQKQDNQVFHNIKGVLVNLILKFGIPVVSSDKPITRGSKEAFLSRIAVSLNNSFPIFEKIAIKWIPEADFHTSPLQTIMVNCSSKGERSWQSTGLFASPGKITTIIFPEFAVNKGLQVQIGCHADDLTHLPELKRAPVVVHKFIVDKVTLPIASVFGGLLYIIVPKGCEIGNIQIWVEGAVLAPYYKHGETSDSSWADTICHFPAPWAELETTNIILTIPSTSIRTLRRPSEILAVWDRIMEGILKFSALPSKLERKERIVADIQISAGFLHSGYPIMCTIKSTEDMLEVTTNQKGLWGFIHELGHNQQMPQFELRPHTTEATCNLWAVYVFENVLGIPRAEAHGDLRPHVRRERIKKYVAEGAQLDKWKVWVCLETYLQLQEAFSWEPFVKLLSEYRNIENIKSDITFKMNLWVEKFSLEVQRNLVPFFEAWGWNIDLNLSEKLSTLPDWKENPMKEFIE